MSDPLSDLIGDIDAGLDVASLDATAGSPSAPSSETTTGTTSEQTESAAPEETQTNAAHTASSPRENEPSIATDHGATDLRAAYEALKEEYEPVRKVVEEIGGVPVLEAVKSLALALHNPAATADDFLEAVKAVNPSVLEEAFWAVATQPRSRDRLVADWFGVKSFAEAQQAIQGHPIGAAPMGTPYEAVARGGNPVTASNSRETTGAANLSTAPGDQRPSIGAVPMETSQGPPLPATDEWGNPLPEGVRAAYERMYAQMNGANRQLQARLDAIEASQQQAAQAAAQAQVAAAEGEFLQTVLAPLHTVIKQMGWEQRSDDTPEEASRKAIAAELLQAAAPQLFESNAQAKQMGERALGLISKAGRDQAWRFIPQLQHQMRSVLARHAENLNRLIQADRELHAMKLERATQARPEVSGAGAAAGNSAAPTQARPMLLNSKDPFNLEDLDREIADRERSGWFNRFRR